MYVVFTVMSESSRTALELDCKQSLSLENPWGRTLPVIKRTRERDSRDDLLSEAHATHGSRNVHYVAIVVKSLKARL